MKIVSNVDKLFIVTGLLFAGVGLLLGEHMGRTGNHGQMPTHAHLMLVGCVLAILYGLIYRAWPALKNGVLPAIQFAAHSLGAVFLTTALFYIFGGRGETGFVVPMVAAGGVAVIAGWALFLLIFLRRSGASA